MSASIDPNAAPKRFTAEDIQNLTLLSHFQFLKKKALSDQIEASADTKQAHSIDLDFKLVAAMLDLTKFLSLFGENSAAARILYKEAVPLQLDAVTHVQKKLQAIRSDKPIKKHRRLKISCKLDKSMLELPHIAQAFSGPPPAKPQVHQNKNQAVE